jgi:hypothetical protein
MAVSGEFPATAALPPAGWAPVPVWTQSPCWASNPDSSITDWRGM